MTKDPITQLQESIEELQSDTVFLTHAFTLDIAEQVAAEMHLLGKNQTWLSEQLSVSRQRISNILSGAPNITARTMVNLAFAFGVKPVLHLNGDRCPMATHGAQYETWRTDRATSASNNVEWSAQSTGLPTAPSGYESGQVSNAAD